MSRKALFAVVLMVSIGLFGQRSSDPGGTPSSGQNAPPTGAAQPGMNVVPQGNVPQGNVQQLNPYYLYPDTAGGVQPVPMLVTPTASFDSPPPTAGISNAGRAGISVSNPANTGVTTTLPPSTMVYSTTQPESGVVANPAPGATGNESGRLINDMGPSYYSDALPAAGNVSLAEVAAQFKASRAAVNARVLTNDDIGTMVSNQTGVTVAKNMPPLGPGVAGLIVPAQSSAQAGSAQSAPQPAPQNAQSTAGTPPPASTSQAAGEAGANHATTPQINQKPQSNDAQGSSRLPATSTLLPLLGLLGAVSGGIGLCFRKFRK